MVNPKSYLFSSLLRDRIKQMKILYYALNLKLYKLCTGVVQDKFQPVMSFPDAGLCLHCTPGICTEAVHVSDEFGAHALSL